MPSGYEDWSRQTYGSTYKMRDDIFRRGIDKRFVAKKLDQGKPSVSFKPPVSKATVFQRPKPIVPIRPASKPSPKMFEKPSWIDKLKAAKTSEKVALEAQGVPTQALKKSSLINLGEGNKETQANTKTLKYLSIGLGILVAIFLGKSMVK